MNAGALRAKTSFYWPMRLLPQAKRNAMFALYGYCRALDDIADDPGGSDEKRHALTLRRDDIDALFAGNPRLPEVVALREPLRRFALPKAELLEIIAGMEMDVAGEMFAPDLTALRLYCRRVAGAVGLLAVRIMGADGDDVQTFAVTLGEALQLTNILRDIDEDAALGRLYLPRDFLQAEGISPSLPLTEILSHPSREKVCARLTDLADRRFQESRKLLSEIGGRQLRPAIAMMAVYARLFERLKARGFAKPAPRLRLSKTETAWVALRHMLLASA